MTSNAQAPRTSAVIVFDLDGTLIDATADLTTAVNLVRDELGLGALSRETVKGFVGEGARVLLRRSLPEEIAGGAFDEAYASFYRHYESVCTANTRAFPGVDALFAGLAAEHGHLALALCTNKPQRMTELILVELDLHRYLVPIIGGDTLATRKPDPAGLQRIAAHHGIAPQRMILVGDTAIDARTAEAAGCQLALVEWGYGEPHALRQLPAAIRASDIQQLHEQLSRWAIDLAT